MHIYIFMNPLDNLHSYIWLFFFFQPSPSSRNVEEEEVASSSEPPSGSEEARYLVCVVTFPSGLKWQLTRDRSDCSHARWHLHRQQETRQRAARTQADTWATFVYPSPRRTRRYNHDSWILTRYLIFAQPFIQKLYSAPSVHKTNARKSTSTHITTQIYQNTKYRFTF